MITAPLPRQVRRTSGTKTRRAFVHVLLTSLFAVLAHATVLAFSNAPLTPAASADSIWASSALQDAGCREMNFDEMEDDFAVVGLRAEYVGWGRWTVFGYVANQPIPSTPSTVYFGGLAQFVELTTTTDEDGYFEITVQLPPGGGGIVLAQAVCGEYWSLPAQVFVGIN